MNYRSTSLVTAYASPSPSLLACCAVRLENLPEALQNIRDSVKDQSKEYVNPTTLAKFPAGMFKAVKAQQVMDASSDSAMPTIDRKQLMTISSAVAQHEGMFVDIPHANFMYDFHIGINGRTVTFEAKMNYYRVFDGKMVHPVFFKQKRILHHTQTFQYFWTQSGDEAYVIPTTRLPSAWYTQEDRDGSIPIHEIEQFKIKLYKGDWVSDLVAIIDATWQEVINQPTGAKPVVPRFLKTLAPEAEDDPVDPVAVDDDDVTDDEADQDPDVRTRWLHFANPQVLQERTTLFPTDSTYLHLLRFCAHQ